MLKILEPVLQTILVIAFLIKITRGTLSLVYLWQLKEYRFDRVWIHLRETYQGRQSVVGRENQIKWLLIILFPLILTNPALTFLYGIAVLVVFLFDVRTALIEVYSRTLKRPVFTLKATFIFLSVVILEFLLINIAFFDIYFWALVLDRMVPIFTIFFVFFLSFPTEIWRENKILQAIKYLRKNKQSLRSGKLKNLLVIGVTGSYGKSSTKEFIAKLLSYRFRVLKTRGTNNTPIGIANTITSKDFAKNTEIFVVEMGAYKKGEITQMCQIVRPKIGVLTGISPQHMSLFGSINNIIEGKYELIEALPKNGLAIFNGNNNYCRELYEKTEIRKLIYSFGEKSDIKVSNIRVNKFNVNFRIHEKNKVFYLSSKLLGKQNIEDLLAAILIARFLGMDFTQIKNAVSSINYLPMTMKPIKTHRGAVLIDDTFNASPDSVLAAIDYMRVYKRRRKILVLQPMIELGKEVKDLHYKVGQACKSLTKVFLTNDNFYRDFMRGAKKKNLVEVLPPQEIARKLRKWIGEGDVVVFEGKESLKILKDLKDV